MRGKKDPYVPGTRRYEGRGMCSTCWKRDAYGHHPKAARPTACLGCNRGWDVVHYNARGLCNGCYATKAYRDAHELVRTKMPAACVRCERPLRAQRAPATPGTVRFAARGMCGSCYAADGARKRGVTPRQPPPTECGACHRPMVSRKAPLKPGHVRLAGNGMCGACRSAAQRREKALLAYVLGGAA